MKWLLILLQLIALFVVVGCDISSMSKEVVNRVEYSVLQHYEYEYREAGHDKSYMVFRRALNTDLTVLAFPVKGKSVGYVVMLASAEGEPKVKVMKDVDFEMTGELHAAVKAEAILSKEVDQFLAAKIR